jgi:hypothetical protein
MDLTKTQLVESVFAGGGEMGARMRALDWSQTVLGPLEHWPQIAASLRSRHAGLRVSNARLLGTGLHDAV